MTHLSLGVGAQHLEGLSQRNPFSGLLRVTLAVQAWEEHDKVQPQGLMMATESNTTPRGDTQLSFGFMVILTID